MMDSKQLTINPYRFYDLVQVQQRMTPGMSEFLDDFGGKLAEKRVQLEADYDDINELYDRFVQESEKGVRERLQSDWATSEEHGKAQDPYRNTLAGESFLHVILTLSKLSRDMHLELQTLVELLRPTPLILQEGASLRDPWSFKASDLQQLSYEIQINSESVTQFTSGVLGVRDGRKSILKYLDQTIRVLDNFYTALVRRHMTEGVPILVDPLLTDVALCIYENVDSHGEIENGSDPNKVSAYSVRKAKLLIEATSVGRIGTFLREPASFLDYVRNTFRSLWADMGVLEEHFDKTIEDVHRIVNPYAIYAPLLDSNLASGLRVLDTMDPRSVTYRDPGKLLSPEERKAHNFWVDTLQGIVEKLSNETPSSELVQYILQRKFELRGWQQDENSFYVCRIGSGNQFRGVAPGALEVVPGARPTVKLDEIIGAGFDDVRAFVEQVESAAKWHDLFVATSPSRTADKSNVLLIGPQGCGKCVTGDTRVFTSRGLCRIKDLHPGEIDSDGYAPLEMAVRSFTHRGVSSHFYDSGVQPTFKVETKHGYQVEGTDKHQVIVATAGGPAWKRLDAICEEDLVGIIRYPDIGVADPQEEWFPMGPDDVDEEDAYLLGYWIGDGSYSQKTTPRFSVGAQDMDYFKEFVLPALEKRWGVPHVYQDKRGLYDVQVFHMHSGATALVAECGSGASHKRVPETILRSSKRAWRGFLSGLFDADGSAYQSRVEWASNSEDLIRTVQTMLTAFGIVSAITSRTQPGPGAKEYVSWRMFLYGENARRFFHQVGFRLKRKMAKLAPLLSQKRNDNWDCIPVSRELWKALKRQAGKLPRAIHKALDPYMRGHYPSRHTLSALLALVGVTEGVAFEAIQQLADPKWFWDRVQAAGATGASKQVYDLVVPEEQSFAANGFMNHNTEILRGVGADKRSISIFAQGSDFNTCWLGEASKNPKRLFQAGLQLQKKANKHVHFLIDEIDAILNNDRQNAGYINLTLEFQILMDGVVQYPHLSVWGTTNSPNRIPMPMIRRFSKVAIVGELDQSDRIRLLKHFTSFLPCAEITDESWKLLADKLEGATGDVIRKVVDTVWRETMTRFVMQDPGNAETLVRWLNRNAKFDIGSFEGKERRGFQEILRKHFGITAEQLDVSVEKALDNVAILHEIETAKMVYRDAQLFMASVTEDRGGCPV